MSRVWIFRSVYMKHCHFSSCLSLKIVVAYVRSSIPACDNVLLIWTWKWCIYSTWRNNRPESFSHGKAPSQWNSMVHCPSLGDVKLRAVSLPLAMQLHTFRADKFREGTYISQTRPPPHIRNPNLYPTYSSLFRRMFGSSPPPQTFLCPYKNQLMWDRNFVSVFNIFHVRALYYTKTLITNKCTKRVLLSIVTHSYMCRPCWVIFRENFLLSLH
jgi:hypothetical protein